MALREIRKEGDEILRKKSKKVEVVDDKIREILNDMDETMHASNGGGLAAVQVGILKRLVTNTSHISAVELFFLRGGEEIHAFETTLFT